MFDANNLNIMCQANGYTQWHYITGATNEQVLAKGYFDNAHQVLRKGDTIIAIVNLNNALEVRQYYIKSNVEGAVAIAPIKGE